MRRNLVVTGILLSLGAVYESLYVFNLLPISILAPMPLFTPQTLPPLAVLTLFGGIWLLLKGLRGIGDLELVHDAILIPGRSVRQILRRLPSLLPLDRVSGVRILERSTPSKLEVRYRTLAGQERRLAVPLGVVADLDGFLTGLSECGIQVGRDA